MRYALNKRLAAKVTVLISLVFFSTAYGEVALPNVHGYGLRACESFLATSQGKDEGDERMIAQYLSYQDWLGGLVTGLSLATDMDVLQGVKIEGALRRIKVYCDDHPTDDFFTGSMNLIKTLSRLN